MNNTQPTDNTIEPPLNAALNTDNLTEIITFLFSSETGYLGVVLFLIATLSIAGVIGERAPRKPKEIPVPDVPEKLNLTPDPHHTRITVTMARDTATRIDRLVNDTLDQWRSTELNPETLLTVPTLLQISAPPVGDFHEFRAHVVQLSTLIQHRLGDYADTRDPDETEIDDHLHDTLTSYEANATHMTEAWIVAVDMATRIGVHGVSHRQLRRARRLVTTIADGVSEATLQATVNELTTLLAGLRDPGVSGAGNTTTTTNYTTAEHTRLEINPVEIVTHYVDVVLRREIRTPNHLAITAGPQALPAASTANAASTTPTPPTNQNTTETTP